MLTSLHLQNFKGFKDTLIPEIRKINLILGGQNVGKTSLLEAIYLGASKCERLDALPAIFRISEGQDARRYLDSTFVGIKGRIDAGYDLDYTVKSEFEDFDDIQARATLTTLINQSLSLSSGQTTITQVSHEKFSVSQFFTINVSRARIDEDFPDVPKKFAQPLSISVNPHGQLSAVELFDQVVFKRKKKQLLDSLKRIEPRLEDMHSGSRGGESRVYLEIAGLTEAVPLPQLGHGFSRVLQLYCGLLVTDAKLALIDEIENGIHYASLPTLFEGVLDMAVTQGVQAAMTTHSWECIRAAYKAFADAGNLKDFQLIRLERDADNIRAVIINDEMLDTVMEAGYEIR